MRSSIVVSSLFAALAIASPVHQALHKKAYVYDIVTELVTVTVTAGQEPETIKVQKTVYVKPMPASTTIKTTKSRKPKPTTTSVAPPPPPPTTTSVPPPPPPPPSTTTQAPVVVYTPPPAPVSTTQVKYVAPVVEVAPTPSPTPKSSSGGQSSSGNAVRDAAINYHNEKRALHNAGPVSWDERLASDAQKLADKCINDHEIYGSYGQNIASAGDSRPNAYSVGQVMKDAASGWYNEVKDFKAMGLMGQADIQLNGGPQVLHFTQFVWKATTKIGCAVSYCGTNGNIFGSSFYAYTTVCNYAEAGNFAGRYASNVS